MGILVAAVGVILLSLAAGDALAGTELGGGDNTLRGSRLDDRMAGFGGDDLLHGRGGNDAIYGGPGSDELLGGTGYDFFETKDGAGDYVNCGPGTDTASVDPEDRVSRTCETVYPG